MFAGFFVFEFLVVPDRVKTIFLLHAHIYLLYYEYYFSVVAWVAHFKKKQNCISLGRFVFNFLVHNFYNGAHLFDKS